MQARLAAAIQARDKAMEEKPVAISLARTPS
jgi:hypothetical protein